MYINNKEKIKEENEEGQWRRSESVQSYPWSNSLSLSLTCQQGLVSDLSCLLWGSCCDTSVSASSTIVLTEPVGERERVCERQRDWEREMRVAEKIWNIAAK